MKYRNACLLLLALICALSLLGCSAANEEPDADPVVARYRDTEIRQSLVDYEKKIQSALSGGKEVRDRDAVDQLLVNLIMLDEAEALGRSRPTVGQRRSVFLHGMGNRLGVRAALWCAAIGLLLYMLLPRTHRNKIENQ